MSNAQRAILASAKDIGTACADCPARNRKPRSYIQHKRYFALIKAVLHQWPESHERQFPNETALRKWLQMKAGHFTTKTLDLYGIPAAKARPLVEAALDAAAPRSNASARAPRDAATLTSVRHGHATCAFHAGAAGLRSADSDINP